MIFYLIFFFFFIEILVFIPIKIIFFNLLITITYKEKSHFADISFLFLIFIIFIIFL